MSNEYQTNNFSVAGGNNREIFEMMCEIAEPEIIYYDDGTMSLQNPEDCFGEDIGVCPLDAEHGIELGDDRYEKLLLFLGNRYALNNSEIIDIIARTAGCLEVVIYEQYFTEDYAQTFAVNTNGRRLYPPLNKFLHFDQWPGYIKANWGMTPNNMVDDPTVTAHFKETPTSLNKFF